MAEKFQQTSTTDPATFIKGMVKDVDESFFPEGSWYHLRNGVNNSKDGNEGTVSNEPSNTFCTQAPFQIIGAIHLDSDRWAIFSTNNTLHEIGIFTEATCQYDPLRNSLGQAMNQNNCLNFSLNNIIIGVAKENFDCTWQTYWADSARNPDRTIKIDAPAFIENCVTTNNCLICTPTTDLDCEALRLAPLVTTPCLEVSKGPQGGAILNGSYYAIVAYVLNSQRVTDYYMPSNTQAIFNHDNLGGSLQIDITQMDRDHFDHFELVIVRFANSQTSAKKIGIYSTRQAHISLDHISEALPSIPVEQIPLRTPNYEKSDGIFEIGEYMLRTGPRSKFDFNYQPLANQIKTTWQAVAYPSNYYKKGGNATSYLRDEVYPFFIRWVYDTAEKSSSYHIPGRPARVISAGPPAIYEYTSVGGINALDASDPYFEINNTASGVYNPALVGTPQPDGGFLIAEGEMGYWQSTEIYPDKKPNVFNANSHPWSAVTTLPYTGTQLGSFNPFVPGDYDICGQPIRHHKFPDNKTIPHFRTNPAEPDKEQIIVLGVNFDNVLPPVDNQGNLIPGIVGYEILRGSREGNKTVIAKGMLNNMRSYDTGTPQVGLYPNYPFNSLQSDESLTPIENEGENPIHADHGPLVTNGPNPAGAAVGYSQNQFTFHSPDTSFNKPFLSPKELKLYGEISGSVVGSFDESPKHPKEKLMTDVAFVTAAVLGIGAALVALRGKNIQRYSPPVFDKNATHGLQTNPGLGFWGFNDLVGNAAIVTAQGIATTSYNTSTNAYIAAEDSPVSLTNLIFGTGTDIPLQTYRGLLEVLGQGPGMSPAIQLTSTDYGDVGEVNPIIRGLTSATLFSHFWTIGTDAAMNLITALIPYTQYAYRYTSHGYYNQYSVNTPPQFRHQLTNAIYLGEGFQNFGENSNARVNNTNRSKTVALQTLVDVSDPTSTTDNTAQTIGSSTALRQANSNYNGNNLLYSGFSPRNAILDFNTTAVSHYTAMKHRMRNQYGQLDGIIQVPVSTCLLNPTALPLVPGTPIQPLPGPLFNGDTYIGRYTEKNTFFYFWDWLYDQPEGFEFDYSQRYMLHYPRYWANFTKFDTGEFLNSFVTGITTLNFSAVALPSLKHSLDGPAVASSFVNFFEGILRVTDKYFYTFNSGVKDFFVESEINIDLRDWNEPIAERYYDSEEFTDLRALFEPGIIKSGNFFKYDQSLSISRMFNNFFSWGNVQDRDYNPDIALTCFTYYRKRVIYSLPQNLEAKKDFWRVFLANNYKDFKSMVTAVESINKNGAMFFFQEQSPVMYQGVDTLQTDLGTKITIGDGGLFSQPEQSVVNANESYEYGSCQNRLSVANTPVGLFWISENQGKIFKYAGNVTELSGINMKFWFSRYLPYQLTKDFPNFDLLDNPVAGIGCQSIFNNRDTVLFFTKKDYKLRSQYVGVMQYIPLGARNPGFFLGAGFTPIKLGDPVYFEDASWTISFDPRNNTWQSFHDWHPDLMLPGKTHQLTTVKNPTTDVGEIWMHTDNQTSFCNFYGVDYPFELDYISQTGQSVEALRSIEYLMEAHIYRNDKADFYHVLDWNFDHAVIYNSEQVSGVLLLNPTPKNDIVGRLLYPKVNPNSIDILFDKVEQKYRFNQFWDITDDRGEFTFPNVQRPIWDTQSNGYIRALNPANLNYSKSPLQRKKFRHYAQHVLLYKNISSNVKLLMRVANNKNLISKR